MIAFCGLDCVGCLIYQATREPDANVRRSMRLEVVRRCRDLYGQDLTPEDVTDCDGCRAITGRLFSSCLKCEIRKCARQSQLDSCAFCPEYACEKLQNIFRLEPAARGQLEKIRESAGLK